jgi:hypothetical protein
MPARRPPRAVLPDRPPLVGREEQLALIRRVVRDRAAVEFTAPCGSGKTTLLRNAVPDAYIRVGGTGFADLLRDLVSEFYLPPAGRRRLSDAECRRLLGQVRAVVALDDIGYRPERIAELRRVLSGCTLLLGTARPVLGPPAGASYPLPGLAEPAALALLAQDAGYLQPSELPAVRRLVAAVGGRPLHLRQAAALVRFEGRTFTELARRAEADPGVLDELSISAIRLQAKRVLAVLTLLGGILLPVDLVTSMADLAYISGELESLTARGLAEEHDDRFGLPVCKSEPYRQILYRQLGLATSLRALTNWLAASDQNSADARAAAEAALGLLGFAAEQGQWEAIVRLTTVVERVLFVQGHWQGWQQALGHGIEAARQAGNAAAGAYHSHQQGTAHFLEGRVDAARADLQRALDLRTRLGDTAGAAVTRANLELIAAPPAPLAPPAQPSAPFRPYQPSWQSPPSAAPVRPASVPSAPSVPPPPADRRRRRTAVFVGTLAAVILVVILGQSVFGRGGRGGGGSATGSGSGSVGSSSAGSTGSVSRPPSTTPVTSGAGGSANGNNGGGNGSRTGGGGSVNPAGGGSGGNPPPPRPPAIQGAADYGDLHVTSAGVTVANDFTVTNPNDRSITLDDVGLGGQAGFSFAGGTCVSGPAPTQLAAGASCTVTVQFSPQGLGARTDTLRVTVGGKETTTDLTARAHAEITVHLVGGSDSSTATTTSTTGPASGHIDVTADGLTTLCDTYGACIVRFYSDAPGALTLAAVPQHGYKVSQWTGACTGSSADCAPVYAGQDLSTTVSLIPDIR